MTIALKKLIYRSKNRGCKEMDIALGNFAVNGISSLNNNELQVYEQLLEEPDNDIWNWLVGAAEIPQGYEGLIQKIKNAVR